jgi:ELWxxDGT repeat protein
MLTTSDQPEAEEAEEAEPPVEYWKMFDINAGGDNGNPQDFAVLNGVLYFQADDDTNGSELWKYDPNDGPDGTTSLVEDIYDGSEGSSPYDLTVLDGILYFRADDDTNGSELWKYDPNDGPDGTTSLVDDIHDGSEGSSPYDLTVLDGVLYFSAKDGTNGRELWKYDPNDGPDGTTSLVDSIRDGSSSSNPADLTVLDGVLYFGANDGTNGIELWKYDPNDGPDGTTSLVDDIYDGSEASYPHDLNVHDGVLYFSAEDGTNGEELWKYDPTDGPDGTTSLVDDIRDGSSSSSPSDLTVFDGVLYFRADDGTNGEELWKYDGESPPSMVADAMPGGGSSSPDILTVWQDKLWLELFTPSYDGALYTLDGDGLSLFKSFTDIQTTSALISGLVAYDGAVYFSAEGSVLSGQELWKYDPDTGTTSLVEDIYDGSEGSFPSNLTVFDGVLYFGAYEDTNGRELWKYDPNDGPDGTTSLVDDIWDGSEDSSPYDLTVLDGVLYFSAIDDTNGEELWKYDPNDGPDGTTSLVDDIYDGSSESRPEGLTVHEGVLYFAANDGTNGRELWKYDPNDGPDGTTSLVDDIYDGSEGSDPYGLIVHEGVLYFAANDGTNGRELWKYDPNDGPDGTASIVDDIWDGSSDSRPYDLTVLDGVLYFFAADGTNGSELWKYDPNDGPDGTTSLVDDIRDGSEGSSPEDLTVFDGVLYFQADDDTNGSELWKYDPNDGPDGTTSLVDDIHDGSEGSSPYDLTVHDGVLYFSAYDDITGKELWTYTPDAGVSQAVDVNQTINDDLDVIFAFGDDYLVVQADTHEFGEELWIYNADGWL